MAAISGTAFKVDRTTSIRAKVTTNVPDWPPPACRRSAARDPELTYTFLDSGHSRAVANARPFNYVRALPIISAEIHKSYSER